MASYSIRSTKTRAEILALITNFMCVHFDHMITSTREIGLLIS